MATYSSHDSDVEVSLGQTDQQSSTADPYQPRQRVIVFKDEPIPGATLAYYGVIIRLLTQSVRRNQVSPDLWQYRVYVPYFHKCLDVNARDMYSTGGLDLSELPIDEHG